MKNGFIKLHRKIVDWEWYDDINTKVLFIHILLMANYEDKKWHGEVVQRGSFITSLNSLSVQTGLSTQEVRTSLKKLISTNDISKISNAKNTVIIVPNYDIYQDCQQENEQTNNKQITDNKQASNTSSTTTKNKRNKEYIYMFNFDDAFDKFWDSYPKKIGKKKAKDKFIKVCKNEETMNIILNALEKQKKQDSWIKDNGQFIPHPATWLNGERWNDEVETSDKSNKQFYSDETLAEIFSD